MTRKNVEKKINNNVNNSSQSFEFYTREQFKLFLEQKHGKYFD
jgi:hypothetical protein